MRSEVKHSCRRKWFSFRVELCAYMGVVILEGGTCVGDGKILFSLNRAHVRSVQSDAVHPRVHLQYPLGPQ